MAKRNEKVISDREAAIARGKAGRRAAQNPNRIPAPPAHRPIDHFPTRDRSHSEKARTMTDAIPGATLLEKAKKLLSK
jgi:hypothetical protein